MELMSKPCSLSSTPQNDVMTDGWQGQLSLEFDYIKDQVPTAEANGTTRLIHNHGIAPLKVQRPFYPEGPHICHSVVVHTAGGMVGGDRLNLSVDLHPSAHALVTTAAASKVYKSNGQTARQSTRITIGQGGYLEWFPQPLILFNGAQYHQDLRIDLAPGAIWMGWDITRLGRTLRQESFEHGVWRSRIEVWQDNYPLWIDPQWIQGGSEMLTSSHGLDHCPVMGTFAIVGLEVNEDTVHQSRQLWVNTIGSDSKEPWQSIPGKEVQGEQNRSSSGVSQLQLGLICRYRGHSTIVAQHWFMAVWHLLRQGYLSRPSCIPRVWQINQRSHPYRG